ncbi:hypothetical protein [Spirosoma sp.]|uniref:hypothetical protein n=1 Tax=Spirosoma sp. TaxID=1899569 RepID=UPI003B3B5EA8
MKILLLLPALLVLEFIVAIRYIKSGYQPVTTEQAAETVQYFNVYRVLVFSVMLQIIISL